MKRLSGYFAPLLFFVLPVLWGARASAQLTTGSLVFTSYSADGTQTNKGFSFLLLITLPAGTDIYFTDRGYNGSAFGASTSTEGTIKWTSGNADIPIGTEVLIYNTATGPVATIGGTQNGTVTRIEGQSTYGTSLSAAGDQIIALTGPPSGSFTVISGLHFNYCTGTGNTTTSAAWDNASCYSGSTANASLLPPGTTDGSSAFWVGTTTATGGGQTVAVYGKFNCATAGLPSGNVATIRSIVYNQNNWTKQNTPFSTPATATGCTYYGLPAPVITVDPKDSTICSGNNATFSITATGTVTGYQWQVKSGAGAYTNITNAGIYSGATSATLTLTGANTTYNGNLYRGIAINNTVADTSAPATLTVTSGLPTISVQPNDASICPNGGTILSGAATNGTITYKWQVDNNGGGGFVNITDGGVYANSGTASLTITGAPTTMYGYKYRLTAKNACGTTNSNAVVLTFSTSWTGNTNTNWNVAGNWACNVVPDAATDVVINPTVNAPAVSGPSQTAHNISIGTGATLTLNSGATFTVTGDISNLGTFTTNSSTVVFNSSAAQSVPGATFANVTLSGGGTKTLSGSATITGTLAFSAGKLQLGANTLTIGPSGSITGVSSSQYIVTNGAGGLRMNAGATQVTYPIGTSSSYVPAYITNAGTADNITASVIDGVYRNYIGNTPVGAPITTKVVNKTWFLSEDVAGGSNATVTLQWNAADELSFTRSLCFVSHYTGTWDPGTSNAAASGSNPYTRSRSNITSFSPFGVGNAGSPLPLKLLTFNGRQENDAIRLSWETAEEKDLESFGIERSADGNTFSNIGNVAARNEAGSYNYLDQQAPSALSRLYYRLKIGERGGSYSYSGTISVEQDTRGGGQFRVSPNPVNGAEIYVQPAGHTEGDLDITITDMSGKQLYSTRTVLPKNSTGAFPVSVRMLPAGTYLLKLQQGASVQTVKIVRH